MLGAGAVVSAVDKSLCVSNHMMEPLQELAIRVEYLALMEIPIRQWCAVRIVAVGLYNGTISDACSGEFLNRFALDIFRYLHPQIDGVTFLVLGNGNKYSLISGTTAFFPLNFSTKIGIVKLHNAAKDVTLIPHFHGRTNPSQHIPGSFVADLNFSSQSQSGDTTLVTGYKIDCLEPLGQGQMTAMHDGVGCQRSLVTAVGALILAACLDGIAMPGTAHRAHKAVRPLGLIEIFHTSFLVRKALNKLGEAEHLLSGHFSTPSFGVIIATLMSNKLHSLQHLVSC